MYEFIYTYMYIYIRLGIFIYVQVYLMAQDIVIYDISPDDPTEDSVVGTMKEALPFSEYLNGIFHDGMQAYKTRQITDSTLETLMVRNILEICDLIVRKPPDIDYKIVTVMRARQISSSSAAKNDKYESKSFTVQLGVVHPCQWNDLRINASSVATVNVIGVKINKSRLVYANKDKFYFKSDMKKVLQYMISIARAYRHYTSFSRPIQWSIPNVDTEVPARTDRVYVKAKAISAITHTVYKSSLEMISKRVFNAYQEARYVNGTKQIDELKYITRQKKKLQKAKCIAHEKRSREAFMQLHPELTDEERAKLYETFIKKANVEQSKLITNLYVQIANEDRVGIGAALDEIEKILSFPRNPKEYTKQQDQMLHTNDIDICPHRLYQALLMLSSTTDNSLIDTFSGLSSMSGYFCRICGEKLKDIEPTVVTISSIEEYSDTMSRTVEYDALYNYVVKDAIFLFNNFVENLLPDEFDVGAMLKSIVYMVKEKVYLIDSKLSMVKTVVKQHINDAIGVYIYIYLMISFVQLIYTNPTRFRLLGQRNGGKSDDYHYSRSGSKSSDYRRSKGGFKQDPKLLKSLLGRGFQIIRDLKKDVVRKSQLINETSMKAIYLKAYQWVSNMKYTSVKFTVTHFFIQKRLIEYISYWCKKPPIRRTEFLDIIVSQECNQLSAILGHDYKTIVARMTQGLSIFEDMCTPSSGDVLSDNNDISSYYGRCAMHMYSYVKERIFKKPLEERARWDEKWVALADEDEKYRMKKHSRYCQPYMVHRPSPKVQVDVTNKCLCTNGRYIYRSSVDDKVVSKDKPVVMQAGWRLHDIECDECDRKVGHHEIAVFYNFYANLCPVEGIHEYDSKNICTKCGITEALRTALDKKYYTKYKSVYNELKKLKNKYLRKQLDEIVVQKKLYTTKELPEWKPSMDTISKVCKLANVSLNLYLNVGLYEGNIFEDMSTMVITDEKESVVRTNSLINYYSDTISKYNVLKSIEYSVNIDPFYKDIFSKHATTGIDAKLDSIQYDVKYFKNMHLYMLDKIASVIHTIYLKLGDSLGLDVLKLLIKHILDSEKKLTKAVVLNFKKSELLEDDYVDDYVDDFAQDELQAVSSRVVARNEIEADLLNMDDVDIDPDMMENTYQND
jgi:hypothetical protein